MESTLDIAPEDWTTFLDAFSRIHRGWRSRIEVLGKEIGAQAEGENLPLIGVSADFKDPGRERVVIALGSSADDHVSHAVPRPTAIRLMRAEDGAVAALEIESEGGPATLLQFESPAIPEAAKGLVHEVEPARR
jgi:hypothetical protein